MKWMLVGVFTALTVMPVPAQDEDVNSANVMLPFCKLTLQQAMRDPTKAMMFGRCVGMVTAYGHMLGLSAKKRELGMVHDTYLCAEITNAITPEQAIKVVMKYIEERPEEMHKSFGALATAALIKAWPCKG